MRVWILAVPLTLVACQKSPGAYESQVEQGGTNGVEQREGGGTDGVGPRRGDAAGPMVRPDLPEAVQPLRQGVDRLQNTNQLAYSDLVGSLRDLGRAMRTLPGAAATLTDAVSRLDSYADRIEAAGATSNMSLRWARRGLAESVDALERYAQEQGSGVVGDRFPDLRDGIDRIDADQPLADQRDNVVEAFDEVTSLLIDMSAPRSQPGTR